MGKRLASLFVALALAGCGAGARVVPVRTAAPAELAAVSVLRTRLAQRDNRVRELETQLALANAETRELRQRVAAADEEREAAARRTVRIGRREDTQVEPPVVLSDARDADEGPRPVLRLVGEPAPSGPPTPLVLPQPPPGVEARLPVSPLPGEDERSARIRADVARIAAIPPSALPMGGPAAAPATPDAGGAAVESYRAALGLIEARRFDDAYAALTDFLARWPSHPYADNAVYWRGEVRYAQRNYVQALHEFEDVVHRYPDGNKTPEALLKIGLCHRRMGDQARAHMFFQRVARQFPDTDAARAAAREDAS